MSETIDIASLCVWSEPKSIRTKLGPKLLRVADPSEAFRALWRSNKDALKAAGIGWEKEWKTGDLTGRINWWQADNQKVEREEKAIAASSASDAAIAVPAPEGCEYRLGDRAGECPLWG